MQDHTYETILRKRLDILDTRYAVLDAQNYALQQENAVLRAEIAKLRNPFGQELGVVRREPEAELDL